MNSHQRRVSRRHSARTAYTYGPLMVFTYHGFGADAPGDAKGKSWNDFRGEHRPSQEGHTFIGQWYEVPRNKNSRPESRDWSEHPRLPSPRQEVTA